MLETVHVAVWVLVIACLLIGFLGALAWKSHVTPKVEAETLLGTVEAKVSAFDKSAYDTLVALEAQSKADAGTAAKYLENAVGVVLKKL